MNSITPTSLKKLVSEPGLRNLPRYLSLHLKYLEWVMFLYPKKKNKKKIAPTFACVRVCKSGCPNLSKQKPFPATCPRSSLLCTRLARGNGSRARNKSLPGPGRHSAHDRPNRSVAHANPPLLLLFLLLIVLIALPVHSALLMLSGRGRAALKPAWQSVCGKNMPYKRWSTIMG